MKNLIAAAIGGFVLPAAQGGALQDQIADQILRNQQQQLELQRQGLQERPDTFLLLPKNKPKIVEQSLGEGGLASLFKDLNWMGRRRYGWLG